MVDQYYNSAFFFHPTIMVLVNKLILIPVSLKKLYFYEMTESLHRAFIATLALLQRQYSERVITHPAEQWFSNIAVSTEVMFKKLQFT